MSKKPTLGRGLADLLGQAAPGSLDLVFLDPPHTGWSAAAGEGVKIGHSSGSCPHWMATGTRLDPPGGTANSASGSHTYLASPPQLPG